MRSVSASMSQTSSQLASGQKVNNAADNAAYWSIATTMRSETKALSAVEDSIGLGRAIVDVTYAGLDSIRTVLSEIRDLFITASSMQQPTFSTNPPVLLSWTPGLHDEKYDGSSVAKIDKVLSTKLQQIVDISDSASFGGVNLLQKPANDKSLNADDYFSVVTGYSEGAISTTSIDGAIVTVFNNDRGDHPHTVPDGSPEDGLLDDFWHFTAQIGNTTYGYHGIIMFNGGAGEDPIVPAWGKNVIRGFEALINSQQGLSDPVTAQKIRPAFYEGFIATIDKRLESVTDGIAYLGAVQKTLETHAELTKLQQERNTRGIGRLVDADMNEVSARWKALQVQEQLASQALNIANDEPKNILALFR